MASLAGSLAQQQHVVDGSFAPCRCSTERRVIGRCLVEHIPCVYVGHVCTPLPSAVLSCTVLRSSRWSLRPLSPEEYATALQSAIRSEGQLYPTPVHSAAGSGNHTHNSATQHTAAGQQPYRAGPLSRACVTATGRLSESRRTSSSASTAQLHSLHTNSSTATPDDKQSPDQSPSLRTTWSPPSYPSPIPTPTPTPTATATPTATTTAATDIEVNHSADCHSPHAHSSPLGVSRAPELLQSLVPSLPPPALTSTCPPPRCHDDRTASMFKVPHSDSERVSAHSARRGSGSRVLSALSVAQPSSVQSSCGPSSPALRSVLLSPLCLSPPPRRLFASPIRKFSSLSVHEANILLAAKQDKAAKLREEFLARQQEKLKAAAQRVEAAEQRLVARMMQKHEAVEGRLTAAQHIHEERVEEKRKKATTENQKVAEVAFINQLTEQMGTDRKAALDKKLSRTEQEKEAAAGGEAGRW